MLVLNKWNRKVYKVTELTDRNVVLEREDGSKFTITAKSYCENYTKYNTKKVLTK